jgi:hypothetical protein
MATGTQPHVIARTHRFSFESLCCMEPENSLAALEQSGDARAQLFLDDGGRFLEV